MSNKLRDGYKIVGAAIRIEVSKALDDYAMEHDYLTPDKKPNRSQVIRQALDEFVDRYVNRKIASVGNENGSRKRVLNERPKHRTCLCTSKREIAPDTVLNPYKKKEVT